MIYSLLLSKRFWIIVALILVLLLLAFGWFKIKSLEKEVSIQSQKANYYKSYSDSTSKAFKNKQGLWVNQVESIEQSRQSLQQAAAMGDKRLQQLLSENKQLNRNFSNLESTTRFTAVNTSSEKGQLTIVPVIPGDSTLPIKTAHLETAWEVYDIEVFKDSVDIKRVGKESFDEVLYWTRKSPLRFLGLGRKTYTSEYTSRNPSTQIITQNSLIVKQYGK